MNKQATPLFGPRRWGTLIAIFLATTAALYGAIRLATRGPDDRWTLDHGTAASIRMAGVMTVHADSVPSCQSCDVRLRHLATLGHTGDPVLLRNLNPLLIQRDSRGRFHVGVRGVVDHEILVYQSNGDFLRAIGRLGSGPGEFQRGVSDFLIGSGDSLYVAHDGRVSVFDSAGVFVRGHRLDPPGSDQRLVAVWQDTLLLNVEHRAAGLAAFPFHLYDRSGTHFRAFGTPPLLAAAATGMRIPAVRVAAVTRDGSLFVAEPAVYRIENTDLQGNLKRVMSVVAPSAWHLQSWLTAEDAAAWWHETWSRRNPRNPPRGVVFPLTHRPEHLAVPPTTLINSMAPLRGDELVIAIHVAATDWRSVRLTYDPRDPSHAVLSDDVFERIYDTVLDVVDTRSGALRMRKRIPGRAVLTSDGTVAIPRVKGDGHIQVEVFEIDRRSSPST